MVGADEDDDVNAVREVEEEIGLKNVQLDKVKVLKY